LASATEARVQEKIEKSQTYAFSFKWSANQIMGININDFQSDGILFPRVNENHSME
jgi:hypothetical protein